ncbi:MAG: alpha/beta fold hydrolase [Rhodospirillales bacterium]|nr:alpha/beta fold hydrolase [Rhodospirillales bacterium]
MALPRLLFDGPATARFTLVLAHGAGAPMDSPYMQAFAEGLSSRGFRVVRFEFPYMDARRLTGKKRPPDRAPVLLDSWSRVVQSLDTSNLIIGGKSMGGRMASLWAAEQQTPENGVKGLVCLGYPFHPPGRPEKLRTAHLESLNTPTLICQGERDTFGTRDDVSSYNLSPSIRLHWLADGDHGFKPRKASGLTEQQNWQSAMDAIAAFAKDLG